MGMAVLLILAKPIISVPVPEMEKMKRREKQSGSKMNPWEEKMYINSAAYFTTIKTSFV